MRLELCYQKKVHYIIEQPKTSLLYSYAPVKASNLSETHTGAKELLLRHGATVVECSLGAFGAPTLKPALCLHVI